MANTCIHGAAGQCPDCSQEQTIMGGIATREPLRVSPEGVQGISPAGRVTLKAVGAASYRGGEGRVVSLFVSGHEHNQIVLSKDSAIALAHQLISEAER